MNINTINKIALTARNATMKLAEAAKETAKTENGRKMFACFGAEAALLFGSVAARKTGRTRLSKIMTIGGIASYFGLAHFSSKVMEESINGIKLETRECEPSISDYLNKVFATDYAPLDEDEPVNNDVDEKVDPDSAE